jgi:glutamate-1-semialdehyde 2,1-aminomutase
MTAGRIAMGIFDQPEVERLNRLGQRARTNIDAAIRSAGYRACVTGAGSLFRVHLKASPPANYRDAFLDPAESKRLRFLVDHLFDNGFMMFNTGTGALSTAMSETEVDQLAAAMERALSDLKANA